MLPSYITGLHYYHQVASLVPIGIPAECVHANIVRTGYNAWGLQAPHHPSPPFRTCFNKGIEKVKCIKVFKVDIDNILSV